MHDKRPKAQEAANVVWALAESALALKDGRLLDDFCMHMHSLLQRQDQQARPRSAQGVATTMWAFAQMKHVPPTEVVSTMLDQFVRPLPHPRLAAHTASHQQPFYCMR